MARSDPLLPNAGIVARREYRDRTRSPLFLASTVLLAILAMMVAVAPIAIRYLDRQTVTRIAVVVERRRSSRSEPVGIADTLLNVPPGGVADPTWERPYSVEVVSDADRALRAAAGRRDRRGPASSSACRTARSTSRCGRSRDRPAPAARS